jgi:hypothetical protein
VTGPDPLRADLEALDRQLTRRRHAVLVAALVGAAAGGTAAALVLVWRSRTDDFGLWTQLGGHLATVVLGALATVLGAAAWWKPLTAVVGSAAVFDGVAALACVPALGYQSAAEHAGPAPWLAIAGLGTAALLGLLWARQLGRPAEAAEPDRETLAAARGRIRRALQRRPD